MPRKVRWVIIKNGVVQTAPIRVLQKNKKNWFGFFVPNLPAFKEAILEVQPMFNLDLKFIEYDEEILVLIPPTVSVYAAQKFRTAVGRVAEKKIKESKEVIEDDSSQSQ